MQSTIHSSCTKFWLLSFLILFVSFSNIYAQLVFQQLDKRIEGPIVLTPDISIPSEPAGYTLILPNDTSCRGMIVFFNSDRDTTNKIFKYANQKQLAVLFLSTGNRLEFLFEVEKLELLAAYIETVVEKYNIPTYSLMFTGMSLAGTRAVKTAIYIIENGESDIQPKAIAICDAPLDFIRFWNSCKKAAKLDFQPAAANEGAWVSEYVQTNLGGTPEDRRHSYKTYAPFTHGIKDGGNAIYLKNTALRAYTEPDVNWWIETRRKDYYDMNAIDAAALVNTLKIMGNKNAELISTSDKGYLPNGDRHPHSWSIVDEKELIDWFLSLLK